MQHFRVKIFARPGLAPDLGAAIPVFHRWIQRKATPEMLIDVADYRHVPAGPSVVLVGHEAFYSLDCAKNRLGLLYNRRTALDGSTQDKIRQALAAAVRACLQLEGEPEFGSRLVFDAGACEVSVNDRLLAPNTEETWDLLRPELAAVLDRVWGGGAYRLERTGERRELLTVTATTSGEVSLESMREALA